MAGTLKLSPSNTIMGKDCFVIKIACDLESYTVVLSHISVILHRSLWFPVVYISRCIRSLETLLFLTGAVSGTLKITLNDWYHHYNLPRNLESASQFQVQVCCFVLVLRLG